MPCINSRCGADNNDLHADDGRSCVARCDLRFSARTGEVRDGVVEKQKPMHNRDTQTAQADVEHHV